MMVVRAVVVVDAIFSLLLGDGGGEVVGAVVVVDAISPLLFSLAL
jgi:hypothetical protein